MNLIRRYRRPLASAVLLSSLFGGSGLLCAQESPRPAPGAVNTFGAMPQTSEYQAVDLLTRVPLVNKYLATQDVWVDLNQVTDELLGATLRPIDGVLRAQLEVPEKQGALVAALRADGPAALAGLRQNDVLLTLAGKPVASSDDLKRLLEESGKSAVPLKLLRLGKPVTLQVQPQYRVTLAPAAQPRATEYYLGVSLDPLDDAIRSQLGIEAGKGVIISDVIKDSPAEKAGIKKNDLAIGLGDTVVSSPEAFAAWVQQNQAKPSNLTVLRAGKPITVPITAAVRKAEAAVRQDLARLAFLQTQTELADYTALYKLEQTRQDSTQRLTHLEKEVESLRKAIDKLTDSLNKSKKE